jgi:hypothetical protein
LLFCKTYSMQVKVTSAESMVIWIAVYLFVLPINGAAFGFSEYYCTPRNIKDGSCKSGDLVVVDSAQTALRFCDFDKEIIPFSARDDFICYYSGSERKPRPRLLTDEEVSQPK